MGSLRRLSRFLPMLLIGLGACVGSVNPIYTDDTIVGEPALVGTWLAPSGDVLKVVPRAEGPGYRLTMMDQDGKMSAWVGYLTRLGGSLWLDVAPEPLPSTWSDDYRGAFVPLHQFWVLRQVDTLLRVADVQYDSLRAFLDRNPGVTGYIGPGGESRDIILTGTTTELRTFLSTLIARPGHLEESDEPLRRVH